MEFCPNCNNYIFIKFEKDDNEYKVIHNCKKCGYTADKTDTINTNSCMYYNPNEINKLKYYVKNKHNLKYDPTIPHIDFIPCPNDQCPSRDINTRNDVLYLNIDDSKLYMLYVCNYCQTHWTNQPIK